MGRQKKERPYIRGVVEMSGPDHKPKIRVFVVSDYGVRSRTFSFVSWADKDTLAQMFLRSVEIETSKKREVVCEGSEV